MTGAVLATLGGGSSGGAPGGGGTLGPLAWANVYGNWVGTNSILTIAGITSFHSLTATVTGTGIISYNQNGNVKRYTGAFNVVAGDTLSWWAANNVAGTTKSGTITVNDASNGGALVSSFNYAVTAV